MSIYYNSVGESWFKKNKVVDEDYIAFESNNKIFDKIEMLKLKMAELNFNGSIILEKLEKLEKQSLKSEKNIDKNLLNDIEELCKSYQKDISVAMNNMFDKNIKEIKKIL